MHLAGVDRFTYEVVTVLLRTTAAKQRCPERWSGATRNWQLKDEVLLNPERADAGLLKLAA